MNFIKYSLYSYLAICIITNCSPKVEPQPNQYDLLKSVATAAGINTSTGVNTTAGINTTASSNFSVNTQGLDLFAENGKYVMYRDTYKVLDGTGFVTVAGKSFVTLKNSSYPNGIGLENKDIVLFSSSVLGVRIPTTIPLGEYDFGILSGTGYYFLPKRVLVKNPLPKANSITNTTITAGSVIELKGENFILNNIKSVYLKVGATTRFINNVTIVSDSLLYIPTEKSTVIVGENIITALLNSTETFTVSKSVFITVPVGYPEIFNVSNSNPALNSTISIIGKNLKTTENISLTTLQFLPQGGGVTLVKSPTTVADDGTLLTFKIPADFPTNTNYDFSISVDNKTSLAYKDFIRVLP